MYRTHTCGELRRDDVGKEVSLSGWVAHLRDFSGIIFIDLRDRYGITQIVFENISNEELAKEVGSLGREYCISVKGKVTARQQSNPNLQTGEVELRVEHMEILNPSLIPPFTIEEDTDGGEDQRMQYRYLDLRRAPLQRNLILRHKVLQATRAYLSKQDFLEIETPFLIKSTPEGARDFIVPSRMQQGMFYALPQSPQTFKQLLMVGGYDKYFQIVKCFRDEDLRADRQPEFTQIDCEMSFVHKEDIIATFTGMVKSLFQEALGIDLGEIPHMPYSEAMRTYGSDKPDIRFAMPIIYLDNEVKSTNFPPFVNALSQEGGTVAAIVIQGGAGSTRKETDGYGEFVKAPHRGLNGLVPMKYLQDGTSSSSADKFLDEDIRTKILSALGAKPGDLALLAAGPANKVGKALGELRLDIGSSMGLRKQGTFAPLWVVDFPMFEYHEEKDVWTYMHHPFTSPHPEDLGNLHKDKGNVRALAYDFVLNGVELGGGSIRIHDREIQNEVFKALGLGEEEIESQFGFLLNALQYGAPPHGGIAFGLDRMISVMAGTDSIRDVMAFPKNNAGRDLMLDAPSLVKGEQLIELGLKTATTV